MSVLHQQQKHGELCRQPNRGRSVVSLLFEFFRCCSCVAGQPVTLFRIYGVIDLATSVTLIENSSVDKVCPFYAADQPFSGAMLLERSRVGFSSRAENSCLLFVGEGPGEVFMFEFQSLFPADQLNSAHHRIRLNCACITALLLVENYHFYVCDELGGVYSLSLFL